MLLRFREGSFGHYFDLPQLLRIHGILIHNLLQREINIPGQRDDEMWLGVGRFKDRFGKEELCICGGLKMGPLLKGMSCAEDYSFDGCRQEMGFQYKGTYQTLKTPFTIANLYLAIVTLIKEREDR
ncbi:hypothetical protein Ddye_012420 [Dipteronia dyeriana]|uniref:Uncharacterized protein n=1 Tax=Dipteronia dyeriana TaxID=168575 RepID=A0AAD9X4C7_9ROSI|nr:hypothetical protein Ddye_012420 [Dipteronia dyeriana]